MAVACIQGASRGIGLQFCEALLARPGVKGVVGLCRNPEGSSAAQLRDLAERHSGRLAVHRLDLLAGEEAFSEAARLVGERHKGIDLFLNCSGILSPSGRGETSLKTVSEQALTETFRVNTVGPLLCAKHFGPLMARGSGGLGLPGSGKDQHKCILVNLSARVGSISDNNLGGWYSYRLSKAALNMTTKNLGLELKRQGVVCVSIHPGTVDTDLSAPYHKNVRPGKLFSREQSVGYMLDIVDGVGIRDTGRFFAWDGEAIEW